ncbi:MAG: hypothetical protein WCA23_07250 [Stellaceae bacterium]
MDARRSSGQLRDQQTCRRARRHFASRIQAEDQEELAEVYDRLARAERPTVEEKAATCCYAQSDKQWIADPQGVPWETFFTYGEATVYGQSSLGRLSDATEPACCEASCCDPLESAQPAAATPCCAA